MIAIETITFGDVREIFRRIANGEDVRGDFLTEFARAVVRADDENFLILLPAAARLVAKYQLCPTGTRCFAA